MNTTYFAISLPLQLKTTSLFNSLLPGCRSALSGLCLRSNTYIHFFCPSLIARLMPIRLQLNRLASGLARIDLSVFQKLIGTPLPADALEQNRAWYRIYKTMETDPAVRQVHRDFLLLRDYTGLGALFIVFYGAAGLYTIPSTNIALIYLLMLALQFVLVRQAASNYGIRFVTTVLARRAAKESLKTPKVTKTRTSKAPSGLERPELALRPINSGSRDSNR